VEGPLEADCGNNATKEGNRVVKYYDLGALKIAGIQNSLLRTDVSPEIWRWSRDGKVYDLNPFGVLRRTR
jgi:hypothetical protein